VRQYLTLREITGMKISEFMELRKGKSFPYDDIIIHSGKLEITVNRIGSCEFKLSASKVNYEAMTTNLSLDYKFRKGVYNMFMNDKYVYKLICGIDKRDELLGLAKSVGFVELYGYLKELAQTSDIITSYGKNIYLPTTQSFRVYLMSDISITFVSNEIYSNSISDDVPLKISHILINDMLYFSKGEEMYRVIKNILKDLDILNKIKPINSIR
jgi:hypothetical protein